jgi:hypothetical protein
MIKLSRQEYLDIFPVLPDIFEIVDPKLKQVRITAFHFPSTPPFIIILTRIGSQILEHEVKLRYC